MNYVRSREFCGMGKATELGKTVQNFTKWCNVSTKVISKTKLLMRDQKYQKKKKSCNGLPRQYPISIPILKLQWNGIKTGTSKSWNQLNSRKEYEYCRK